MASVLCMMGMSDLAPRAEQQPMDMGAEPAEGQAQHDAFLQRHPEAKSHDVPGFTGHLLPLADNGSQLQPPLDGFFYALLTRR